MLQFLIPIDFSDTSANTIRFAFELNKHFMAKLHVIHVFDLPFSATPEADTAIYEYDSIRESFTERAWRFINDHRGSFHYDMEVYVTSGGHFQGVSAYAEEQGIDLIILGNKGKSGLSRLLYGSVTQNLIRKSPCPALAIPGDRSWSPIQKMIACTDFSEPLTDKQCHFLKTFAERMEADLNFLHIQDKVEIAMPEDNLSKQKIRQAFGKDPVTAPFERSIPQSIHQYVKSHGGDMIVTIPHRHSWLDHFLLGSETESISEHVKLPLLALH